MPRLVFCFEDLMKNDDIFDTRRNFLKKAALAGAGAAIASQTKVKAQPRNILSEDRLGVLVDTSVCVGCRNCEWACKKAHDISAGELDSYKDRNVFAEKRRPNAQALTVVNEYDNPRNMLLPIDVKVQCMHCDHPACVSACIVGAFSKENDGSVIWDGKKCIGCRYCMVACPFQIPSFDFDKAIEPNIRKCDFCYERKKEGKLPACVEICPVEAMTFGPRSELINIGRDKIKRNPDRYLNHIYGENEVNGTAWMYLSGKSFNDLDFPNLGSKEAPGVSEAIQHGVFAYFVPPVLFFSMLGSIMWITKRRSEIEKEVEDE
jgi:Fe-S-cluster-containing dehydrogenase component